MCGYFEKILQNKNQSKILILYLIIQNIKKEKKGFSFGNFFSKNEKKSQTPEKSEILYEENSTNLYFFRDYESPFDGLFIEKNKLYFQLIDKIMTKMKNSGYYFEKGKFPPDIIYDHPSEENTWLRNAREWNFYKSVRIKKKFLPFTIFYLFS